MPITAIRLFEYLLFAFVCTFHFDLCESVMLLSGSRTTLDPFLVFSVLFSRIHFLGRMVIYDNFVLLNYRRCFPRIHVELLLENTFRSWRNKYYISRALFIFPHSGQSGCFVLPGNASPRWSPKLQREINFAFDDSGSLINPNLILISRFH